MPPKHRYMPLDMYETAVTHSSLSTVWEKDVATATALRKKLQTLLSTDSAILNSFESTQVRKHVINTPRMNMSVLHTRQRRMRRKPRYVAML